MKYLSESPRETRRLARLLATEVLRTKPKRDALVLALEGELGSGKTTFTQEFVRALGIRKKILSPTFVIIKKFGPKQNHFESIYHIDSYRVSAKEILSLGFKKILKERALVIIEWADKLKRYIPKGTIWITFHHGKRKNERYITFNRR